MNPVSPAIADEIQERMARRNIEADLHAVLNSEEFEELFAQVSIEQGRSERIMVPRHARAVLSGGRS